MMRKFLLSLLVVLAGCAAPGAPTGRFMHVYESKEVIVSQWVFGEGYECTIVANVLNLKLIGSPAFMACSNRPLPREEMPFYFLANFKNGGTAFYMYYASAAACEADRVDPAIDTTWVACLAS